MNNMMMDFSSAPVMELSTLQNSKQLSSNFIEIATDCCSEAGVDPKSKIQDSFPVVNWLLRTAVTDEFRNRLSKGLCGYRKNEDGDYETDLPASIWSLIPENSAEECCWTAPDFAKCSGKVVLKMLCLKDCVDIQDDLMQSIMKAGNKGVVAGISNANNTLKEINERIDRLSMAFYSAYTVMLGSLDSTTNILKPFHGLYEVMSNPAVAHISGSSILNAFAAFGCRLPFIGNAGQYIIAVNPLTYQTLLRVVVPGQYGDYPDGWTRSGDEIRFHGISFIQDSFIPVDFSTGTGEAWILNSRALGLFLGTDLTISNRDFIRTSGHEEQSLEDGCGRECKFYYNIGAVINTDARPLAVIQDIPLSGVCLDSTADLQGIVQPQTLIPRGV